MSAPHGWTDAAIRGYEADKAERARDREIRDFRDRATMIAAHYAGDPKGYDVEYSRLCRANAHLADQVDEIADFLEGEEERERLSRDDG